MKNKMMIMFILGMLCSGIFGDSTREQLYRRFGPQLIEAVVMVIKDEINLLRAQHALPARTNQQLVDAIDTKLADVNEYDWMN